MKNQAQTVVDITKIVLGDRFKSDTPVKSILTAEDKEAIVNGVTEMFVSGATGFAVKDSNAQRMADAKELRSYVVGLCNNHWRKHKALNGGTKYVPSYTRSEAKIAA